MQVEFKTDKLLPCVCGHTPTHYTVGYGSTPYDIFCPNCKKQTTFSKYKITGWHGHLIDYWNKHLAKMSAEEVKKEYYEYKDEEKHKTSDWNAEYKIWEYYWTEEEIIKRKIAK